MGNISLRNTPSEPDKKIEIDAQKYEEAFVHNYETTFCTCPICTALKEKMATNPTGEKDISLRLIDTIAALNEAILG